MKHYTQTDLHQVEQALSYIDSDDREVWVSVGNAIKNEFGESGLDLWLDWSANASNFERKPALSVWKSLKKLVVPIGYVFKLAMQYGYEPQKSEPKPYDPVAEAAKRAAREQQAEFERYVIEKERAESLVQSRLNWLNSMPSGKSAYLTRKQVPHEVGPHRYTKNALLIPMVHYDRPRDSAFVGVQTILNDGTKLFPKGVEKSGSACRIGEHNDKLIVVCEGYATGLSIRIGLDYTAPVFVAFDAGNLIKVVQLLRNVYPKPHILVCADNDARTPHNPGIKAGKKAMKQIKNTSIIYPVFSLDDTKNTDFNDLLIDYGCEVLARQFYAVKQAFKLKAEVQHA